MNLTQTTFMRTLLAAAVASTLLVGCATVEKKPAGSERVRAKLTALQSEPNLANAAPVAMKDANLAVQQAEQIEKDLELAAHRVYIADRKIDTARHLAETQYAQEQRKVLNEQSEKARLDARTREADRATLVATTAKADALTAQSEATAARADSADLQRQLAEMQAKPTDRGLVLTLGDTLFATGRSEIQSGAAANLDRLTAFMTQYPDRTVVIEGFTDSMGSEEMNQSLSQRRADAVKNYLTNQGVSSTRLSSSGRGENSPVADNESAAGRQQNRRVEVIINQVAAQ